jgi:TolA-binding protein
MPDKKKKNSNSKDEIISNEDKIENDGNKEEKEIEEFDEVDELDEVNEEDDEYCDIKENEDYIDEENSDIEDDNLLNTSDRKKTIWVYAVILFMSAFIVLLITMFSQIKLNSNYETLKSENSENEEKVGEYKLSFSAAVKENELLSEELSETKEKLKEANKQIESYTKGDESDLGKDSQSFKSYENLLIAKEKFDEDDVVNCALVLKKINYDLLGTKGQNLYNKLLEDSQDEAIEILYEKGIESMESEEYEKAVEYFSDSYSLSNESEYADSCLYYMALCEYNLENNEDALMYIEKIENDFEKSSYLDDSNSLKEIIEEEEEAEMENEDASDDSNEEKEDSSEN